jgi:hypothetical protein
MLRTAAKAVGYGGVGGIIGLGTYSQFEHEDQPMGLLALQACFWHVADQVGVPGSFPYKPDQLDARSFEQCLRDQGTLTDANTHVKSYKSKGFGEGAGFMGCMHRVSVEYEGPQAAELPTKLVAKFGVADLASRVLTRFTVSNRTEVEVYSKSVAKEAGLPQAKCYYARSENITDHVLILLEDLAPLQVADQVKGLSVEQAHSALRQLAKLHSRHWNKVRESGVDVMLNNSWQKTDIEGLFLPGVQKFLDLWPQLEQNRGIKTTLLNEQIVSLALEFPKVVDRLIKEVEPVEVGGTINLTMAHGDYRAENLFFEDGGDEVKRVVDEY